MARPRRLTDKERLKIAALEAKRNFKAVTFVTKEDCTLALSIEPESITLFVAIRDLPVPKQQGDEYINDVTKVRDEMARRALTTSKLIAEQEQTEILTTAIDLLRRF